MNKIQIEKILKLLNEGNHEQAKKELQIELIKASQTKEAFNLIKGIKKFLDDTAKEAKRSGRQQLGKINIQNGGEFGVLDGYVGALYLSKPEGAEILPQVTPEGGAFSNMKQLFNYTSEHKQELTQDDFIILKNIDMFIKLHPQKQAPFIIFKNRCLDAKRLKKVLRVIGEVEDLQAFANNNQTEPMYFENSAINCKGIILPVRIMREEEQEKPKAITQEILQKIKTAKN